MRRINLVDSDIELFNQDITPAENAFLMKHMDAFKRMWHEQGKEFWAHFAVNFISCSAQFGVMKDFPESFDTSQEILEGIFCLIQDQFFLGKFSQAKALLLDVVLVAKNVHLLPQMESNSVARDPFYVKDTRDSFRNLFGPPDVKTSYMNVYVLLPVYSRFGGSVCVCLRRWLSAPAMEPGDLSYWTAPVEGSVDRYVSLSTPEFRLYLKERLSGMPTAPCFVDHWMFGDPRFDDQDNPLYDPSADKLTDWREDLRPSHYIEFVRYVDKHYNPAKHKNGRKDVTAIAKKKIMEESLWKNSEDMDDVEDMDALIKDEIIRCVQEDDEFECNITWYSEREYSPDIPHCKCCYVKDHDNLEDVFVGRVRTDVDRSMVIFYTTCWFHNNNMRIEIPVHLGKYRSYEGQPLFEVEMEMNDLAKKDVLQYVTHIVSSGLPPPPIELDPIPPTELPLYIRVMVKWCQGVHGLRIDYDMIEMRSRAQALKLGYGGLRSVDDVPALTKAVVESIKSFIAELPFSDKIAESCLHQDSRDSSARQRLRRKMKQKKKQQESLKAKKAERDAKALLELFKFEIKNGFRNAFIPKQDPKEKVTQPQEAQVREQLKKDFHKLRDCVTDVSFSKTKDEWLLEEQTFTECLEQAIEETGVEVTTELGFPYGRTSYYKPLLKIANKTYGRVYFNTSSGPRYMALRLAITTRCDNNPDKARVVSTCPVHCPYHQAGAVGSAESDKTKGSQTSDKASGDDLVFGDVPLKEKKKAPARTSENLCGDDLVFGDVPMKEKKKVLARTSDKANGSDLVFGDVSLKEKKKVQSRTSDKACGDDLVFGDVPLKEKKKVQSRMSVKANGGDLVFGDVPLKEKKKVQSHRSDKPYGDNLIFADDFPEEKKEKWAKVILGSMGDDVKNSTKTYRVLGPLGSPEMDAEFQKIRHLIPPPRSAMQKQEILGSSEPEAKFLSVKDKVPPPTDTSKENKKNEGASQTACPKPPDVKHTANSPSPTHSVASTSSTKENEGVSGAVQTNSVRDASSSSPTHSAASSSSVNISSSTSKKLKKCYFCRKTEPEPKTYKKCNKCKVEGVKNARFYCGKECQTEDWKVKHKEEHLNNSLGKRE